MYASRFIAGRLRVKERTVVASIAVSFLVMVLAVSISSGFRSEIRDGLSQMSGDIQLTGVGMNYISEDDPISSQPSYRSMLDSLDGVATISPAIYRAGIVKKDDLIQGVLFKGVEGRDSLEGLGISIPSRMAEMLSIAKGDRITAYFISERLKARNFTVKEIYPSVVETDDNLLAYASIRDMQRLNGWEEDQVSALEVVLNREWQRGNGPKAKAEEVGSISLAMMDGEDDTLVARSITDKYPQLFAWLDLIDFNVVFILILMTIVAGFNMISGLLILLFRNTATIGTLKSFGMRDSSIADVFVRASSVLVLKGMAIGNLLALAFCLVQGKWHLLKLDPANYFVPYVPVSVDILSILSADVVAYLIIMLLMLIPSLFISKVDPAKTMRAQ